MAKYVCSICSYVYDEAVGFPEAGIAPGTKWEYIPDDFKCPICGAGKDDFYLQKEAKNTFHKPSEDSESLHIDKELSPMEMSVICSNLARGCEKQYLFEQSEKFKKLAEFFGSKAEPAEEPNREKLLELIEMDLSQGYPYANAAASEKGDRSALRSLVWSEKVTRMLRSLLLRYKTEGGKMLENTNVYVCTICGFVYVGDNPPEVCPVCKVPSWKFEKIEGRAV
ncbi:MAG: rubredoxin [Clostridiales bacterium]|nr:rubredoxin [Clostridiales bacterium]